jgi:hypothetical protein
MPCSQSMSSTMLSVVSHSLLGGGGGNKQVAVQAVLSLPHVFHNHLHILIYDSIPTAGVQGWYNISCTKQDLKLCLVATLLAP